MSKPTYSGMAGFTLIELMIALIIFGVLVAIALPNYQGHLRRAACEDAKATLTGAANLMERFRAQNNSYTGADLGAYAFSPVDGATKNFNIAITASDASSYTLTATPTANGRLVGRGTLTINSAGRRGATGDLANPSEAETPVSAWESCGGI